MYFVWNWLENQKASTNLVSIFFSFSFLSFHFEPRGSLKPVHDVTFSQTICQLISDVSITRTLPIGPCNTDGGWHNFGSRLHTYVHISSDARTGSARMERLDYARRNTNVLPCMPSPPPADQSWPLSFQFSIRMPFTICQWSKQMSQLARVICIWRILQR